MSKTLNVPIDLSDLAEVVRENVLLAMREFKASDFEKETFSIKDTSIKIKRSENYVRKLIAQGVIKTTIDGKFITGMEINSYLGNCPLSNKPVKK